MSVCDGMCGCVLVQFVLGALYCDSIVTAVSVLCDHMCHCIFNVLSTCVV